MTAAMILTLAIVLLMVYLILKGSLPFGAPPVLACLLLVVTGVAPISQAFSGFSNKTVILIASFMAVLAAFQQTSLITRLKTLLLSLVRQNGRRGYVMLLLAVCLITSIMGIGNTGWYVLVLGLLASLPDQGALPPSRLILPLGFATHQPLIPLNMALQYGLVVSLLEAAGLEQTASGISTLRLAAMSAIQTGAYLLWALAAWKLLPSQPHPVPAAGGNHTGSRKLSRRQEICICAAFCVSLVSMVFLSRLGDVGYVVPGLAAAFLLACGCLSFSQLRDTIGAPIVLMMAGVIGVSQVLRESGLTTLAGDLVAQAVGQGASPFLIVLAFCFLTSAGATIIGSQMGSIFIFAPIAISSCLSLGYDPSAAAAGVVLAGWSGGFLPIDGLTSMIFGLGGYRLSQYWTYTVPMYLVRNLSLAAAAVVLFPCLP